MFARYGLPSHGRGKDSGCTSIGAGAKLRAERSQQADRGKIWRQFLGGTQQQRPAQYRLASPLHHLDPNDPPCWFVTGEKDNPSTHADAFRQRLQELDIASGLTVIEGAPHGFLGRQGWFDQMIEDAARFFGETLR